MYVYFIGAVDSRKGTLESIKIGKANNPFERLYQIQSSTHLGLVMMGCHSYDSEELAFESENDFHKKFRSSHLRGEWFRVSKALLEEICQSVHVTRSEMQEVSEKMGTQVEGSEIQADIISHLKEAGDKGLSAVDLESLTGIPGGTIRSSLRRMLSKRIISQPQKRGKYYHID